MSYNPKTDFVCYARDKHGDGLVTCYKPGHLDGIYNCDEDREILGKCRKRYGCKPSSQTKNLRETYGGTNI
tara:strand:+ start:3340 stop:3552 length:213 start_codon:yes stop_codon:yes gene_type:complete